MPRSATSGRHRQQPCLEDCRQRIFSGRVVCLHPRRHAFTRHTAARLSIFGCPRNRGNSTPLLPHRRHSLHLLARLPQERQQLHRAEEQRSRTQTRRLPAPRHGRGSHPTQRDLRQSPAAGQLLLPVGQTRGEDPPRCSSEPPLRLSRNPISASPRVRRRL